MRKRISDSNIKVEIAKEKNDIRYMITEDGIPIQDACLWLDLMSINSFLTGERYAYALLRYFRFLESCGLQYKEIVSKRTIEEYIKHLLGFDEKIINVEAKMTFTALNTYITVLKSFYHWLEDERKVAVNPVMYSSKRTTQAPMVNTKLLYGQVWDFTLEESILNHVTYNRKRNHLKWYTNQEIEAIIKNLRSLRDRTIFKITIDTGMRIGEVLGLKLDHFDPHEPSLQILRQNNSENGARAKTKERLLFLSPSLASMIQTYISTERYESDIYDTNYLFINLSGVHKGAPLKPRNFLRILKDAGEASNLSRSEIRTHSGRSTRAQQLVELMEDQPELGITETFINEELGWSSEQTIKVYKKGYSIRQRKKIMQRIQPVLLNKFEDSTKMEDEM